MDFRWHFPMKFHFCDFWCIIFCPDPWRRRAAEVSRPKGKAQNNGVGCLLSCSIVRITILCQRARSCAQAWLLGSLSFGLTMFGTGLMGTKLNGYLVLQGNIPLRTSPFMHILKLLARNILGTRWAKYPFSRCRQCGCFSRPWPRC